MGAKFVDSSISKAEIKITTRLKLKQLDATTFRDAIRIFVITQLT